MKLETFWNFPKYFLLNFPLICKTFISVSYSFEFFSYRNGSVWNPSDLHNLSIGGFCLNSSIIFCGGVTVLSAFQFSGKYSSIHYSLYVYLPVQSYLDRKWYPTSEDYSYKSHFWGCEKYPPLNGISKVQPIRRPLRIQVSWNSLINTLSLGFKYKSPFMK